MKLILPILVAAAAQSLPAAHAQSGEHEKLGEATAVVQYFSSSENQSIPVELMKRAHGIAVIPNVIRGGFIFGARRGRGVLVVRTEDGEWSNPAFVTLTGGSIGWQIGAESADVVLVFANDRSVQNIRRGKFTLGGDATAVAGPLGRHATMAVTFRAEVYGYVQSHGLFAGAAFEGMRLAIDDGANARFYAATADNAALSAQSAETPPTVRRFLLSLAEAEIDGQGASPDGGERSEQHGPSDARPADEARTFPLDGAP